MNDKRNENVLVKYLVWLEDEILMYRQIAKEEDVSSPYGITAFNTHEVTGIVMGLEMAKKQLLIKESRK